MRAAASLAQPSSGDDIHSILSRFNAWSGTDSAPNQAKDLGSSAAADQLQEIDYDEAIRRYHHRHPEQAERPLWADAGDEAGRDAGGVPEHSVPGVQAAPTEAAAHDAQGEAGAAEAGVECTAAQGGGDESKLPGQEAEEFLPVPAGDAGGGSGADQQASGAKKKAKPAQEPEPPRQVRKSKRKTRSVAASGRRVPLNEAAQGEKKAEEFRQVLTQCLEAPQTPEVKRRAEAPERTVRISVRFSPLETTMLRAAAADAGLTVSGYLRQRVLEMDCPQRNAKHSEDRSELAARGSQAGGLGVRLARWMRRCIPRTERFREQD